jgi:hypothetical protein
VAEKRFFETKTFPSVGSNASGLLFAAIACLVCAVGGGAVFSPIAAARRQVYSSFTFRKYMG